MKLEGLQEVIEKIGEGLPPGDDWMPALILENEKEATVYGFAGDFMSNQRAKDEAAKMITRCIVEFKPDCACFVTTAWTIQLDMDGVSELDLELHKMGTYKIKDHPKRVEIVNAYVYAVRGPNKGEALMMGYIQRFPDKGPKIREWKIIKEEATAEGRFPDAVKQGFQLAGLTEGG